MANPALALVAGFGGGYMSQQQRNIENARAAAADQRQQDIHDLQMRNAQRDQDLQASLAAAARPAQVDVGAGGMTKPASEDNIDVGQPGEPGADNGGLVPGATVNGQPAGNAEDAAAAATAYNDPNAVNLRQVQAYQQAGKPGDAMALQNTAFKLNKEQTEFARTLKDEGAFDAAKALRQGDGQAMKDAFNKNGQYKIVGDPVITPVQTDVPGIGKITTYNAQYKVQNPDGTTTDRNVNSHDLSMQIMPYEKALELQQKGTQNEALSEYRSGLLDVKGQVADARTVAAQATAAAAEARAALLKDRPDAQERIALTTMANNAQREIKSLRQDIAKHQLDFGQQIRNNPNGPEAKQLADMQAELAQHRTAYANANAGLSAWMTHGRTSATATPAPAAAGTPTAAPPKPSTKADYDAIPSGSTYIAPDGTTRIKK